MIKKIEKIQFKFANLYNCIVKKYKIQDTKESFH